MDVPLELVGRLFEWNKKAKTKGRFPKRTKLYLHSDKDNNYGKPELFGLSDEASRCFAYALCEVIFDVEVDEDGTCRILAVDGRELAA
jgi:hypothetical protein